MLEVQLRVSIIQVQLRKLAAEVDTEYPSVASLARYAATLLGMV